jgi:uncharacterized membrane protein
VSQIGFTDWDFFAVGWFFVCWVGYSLIADHTRLRERTTTAAMRTHRRRWMHSMMLREVRIMDSALQGNLLSGVAFFASTTIFAIGGLLAMLGASDRAVELVADLPFAAATTRAQWEIKVLLLALVFVYAFFKFAWAFRLFNYCSILIGGAPMKTELDDEAARYAERLVQVNALAASHFNRGIRAYFFALATLAWFVHPLWFMVASALVIVVITSREFGTWALLADK